MAAVTIYHNPRCSKSRRALELLKEKGVDPIVVDYLAAPPDAATLESILSKLNVKPRDIMRRKEPEYKESGADNPALSRRQLLDRIVHYPGLLERPIVVAGDKAAIGRPPENVLAIL